MKKQKIIAGLATVALASSLMSTGANALKLPYLDSVSELPDELYTVVGPNYFTISNIESDELYDGNHYAYIEDTDVADFIRNEFGGWPTDENAAPSIMDCTGDYTCIQGKKKGETNIVIEENGDVVKRIHLTSGTFTPEYSKYVPSGVLYEGTGELSGIDNNLLTLDSVYTPSGKVQITKTGARSLKITSNETLDQGKVAYGVWKIGDQYIGGGTTYNIIMVEVNDNVSTNNANRDLLAYTTTSIFETIAFDPWNYGEKLMNGIDLPNLTVANGAVIDITHPGANEYWVAYMPGMPGSKYVVNLDFVKEGEEVEELEKVEEKKVVTKKATVGELPEGATTVATGKIKADVWSVAPNMFNQEEIYTTFIGDIVDFNSDITVTINDVEVEEREANHVRNWYVSLTDTNGKTELIEADFDEKAKTLTFKTSKVGTYSYGFTDEFVPVVPDTGMAPQKVAMVATATFAPLAVLTFIAFGIRNRKKASGKLAKKINR